MFKTSPIKKTETDHGPEFPTRMEGTRVKEDTMFVRLNFSERVQHMVFVACFIILALTGFMIQMPEDMVLNLFGQFSKAVFFYRGSLHRIAGIVMMLMCVYHLYYLAFKKTGRLWFLDMVPRFQDIKDMVHNILYYVGREKNPPKFDRFCYKHKAEYIALVVGTILMSSSGVMLWSESIWSKFFLDIASIIHAMEAVLACLAIIVWHLYEVHLRPHKFPVDHMWITGVIDEEEMKEEYPLHLEKIMNDPQLQKIYFKRGKND